MHVISAVLDVAVSIRFFRIPLPFFVFLRQDRFAVAGTSFSGAVLTSEMRGTGVVPATDD
jgi:hypothetical protein